MCANIEKSLLICNRRGAEGDKNGNGPETCGDDGHRQTHRRRRWTGMEMGKKKIGEIRKKRRTKKKEEEENVKQ
ncbi:hypothetical protein DM860_012008 [Cuscuta australis]|uniref:Uncharacterized protein n=1 Tax=Cuscuta australis TaxID=267555 RepID=A0A328D918_9ASTE|nr:hypothetical protein DM860_012008 [Cuscuta australis]